MEYCSSVVIVEIVWCKLVGTVYNVHCKAKLPTGGCRVVVSEVSDIDGFN